MFRHMFNTRAERRNFGNLFDSMHAFIPYVVLPYEGKIESITFLFLIKIQHIEQRRFRVRFIVETVLSRNTIIYLPEKYIGGSCVSIPEKAFSQRKKQVRAASKTRLISEFVKNDPMKSHPSHRRGRAQWSG